MWDYIGFPDEYRVDKPVDKEKFLKHGNLTDYERNQLVRYMEDIKVLYSIPFIKDGSEMVVLYTDLDLQKIKNIHFVTDYVKSVVQALPYKCMLVLHCRGIIRFYVFAGTPNSVNINRTVVHQCYSTDDMFYSQKSFSDEKFLIDIRDAIGKAKTALQLDRLWCDAVIEKAGGVQQACHYAVENSFVSSVYELEEIQNSQLEFNGIEDILSIIETIAEENEFYDNISSEPDRADKQVFVEFCRRYCRSLYYEVCDHEKEEINVSEWLRCYTEACNNYFREMFREYLNSKQITQILNGFIEEESYDDYYGDLDIEELKNFLPYYSL